ncbi:hypothetical protein M427DRAFT_61643 [Gonapodya prolifera JEL478]|uniref:Uncharacterized protein n=1 Tax=Gonapodya prolifera (strain JEL478) TaxID=1344416 RepID=A0A139A1Y3_GONPJ|nr:hypothetical protein M427DRAFT_61643 [Gonapodya prolifera JEL478]|eukprot:KXS10699.1 hypothetical protein M427DRAFT_61643 [Gonapodya prolifera JEL478]
MSTCFNPTNTHQATGTSPHRLRDAIMPLLNIDPWVCASPSSGSHINANSLGSFVFLTLYGVLLGLDLVSLVQSTLSIQT